MSEKPGNLDEWLKELPVTAEKPGFKPGEMVACEKCARKNPPTRLKCFYCAADLQVNDGQVALIAPNLRQMEPWEKGFNIILENGPSTSRSDDKIKAAAKLLKWESLELITFLQKGRPLPIAKAESLKEAGIFQQRLAEIGFASFVWPDEECDLDIPTRRLRGLEIESDRVTFRLFNTNEQQKIAWSDITLVVTGSIFEKKIASTEKRKKNEGKQVTESSETSHDEPVIDIYSRGDNIGWRILTKGFDFSCVGAQKSLLAVENIRRLVEMIGQHAPHAMIDNGYMKVRRVLGKVWDNEQKMASHNWQRESMGRFHFDNVTAIDNIAQFTKYSRLQWRLLKETGV